MPCCWDFYCTQVDLGDPVWSRGFDGFAQQVNLPLDIGELYRRYVEMIGGEPMGDDTSGFAPYRDSSLSAGPSQTAR
jgi:hypothetical protein